jgi:hypothetical protein
LRGNLALAMQCVRCGTRFHGSDCGGKLADAGYTDMHDKCPKVRALVLAEPPRFWRYPKPIEVGVA